MSEGEYGEVHHIVPKSEGGSDEPDNLVKLTAREHYVAHLLLARIYNDASMWSALFMMSNCKSKERSYKVSSRLYAKLRDEFARRHSLTMKGRISNRKGCQLSNETKNKISKNNGSHREEVRDRISHTLRGRKQPPRSEEYRRHISEAQKGIRSGMHWWNDGKRNFVALECPEGCKLGRLRK